MSGPSPGLLGQIARLARPAVFLGHNGISLTGAVLTTGSALTMLGFWALEVLQLRAAHPYAGIILFLALPVVFVVGLILMPAGALWRRRRLRRAGQLPHTYPKIDLHQPAIRHGLGLVAAATAANVAILSTASYKAVEHMDSTEFCGLTCHNVMAPEHAAYVDSPHSRVACVQCHIGPGASWFVRSKLSGTRQVFAASLGTFSRPIPSPVKHLRPARETCEQCHWPEKFHGDKFLVRTKYGDDEANTPSTTVLVLKVGGRNGRGHVGIHGVHLSGEGRIRYMASDARRQVIPRVFVDEPDGSTQEYASTDVPATPSPASEERRMDCMDCHNRPTHAFELPERAVDRALSEGRINAELPFIRKQAVEVLRTEYPDRQTAAQKIAEATTAFYRDRYPDVYRQHRASIETAVGEVQAIYRRNVFPEMRVAWGTYPNNIGHEDFLGCFRCHDDNHKRKDGRTITQDCDACHTILAQDEQNPKVLADLGWR